MSDPFAEIRPYRDSEVRAVLDRVLGDREFLDSIARLRLGGLAAVIPSLWRYLAARVLRRELQDVSDVHGMQMVIKTYLERMIEDTTAGFTVSGLDALEPSQSYLFMSNHRDIAMDPAFTNYALHMHGHETVRIAIGDNLLTKPWVSDLMRLNKSFLVKRSVSGPRELLAASKQLAAYIQFSLNEERQPVWLAQREGRAKDGIDRTEPAVIKMLSLCRDKRKQSFAEYIRSLRIVPVAISYEVDPCDGLKAAELHELATTGSYEKGEQEDVASIGQGISGNKGQTHVTFGTPLTGDYDTPEEVAAAIDTQVINGYCLHPSNFFAYRMLHGDDVVLPESLYAEAGRLSRGEFEQRIRALPEPHQPYALAIYANSIDSKLTTQAA
ncbi:MAG: 1-acyl-sn-glycerol-3-phosphate acyltransferase [Pseudomonadota bacterium]